jgi:hypothetical protein
MLSNLWPNLPLALNNLTMLHRAEPVSSIQRGSEKQLGPLHRRKILNRLYAQSSLDKTDRQEPIPTVSEDDHRH